METEDFEVIEGQIGYEFRNKDLLQQAFVRKSYSNENGGQNNEVLEFIGDKVLDFVVVKLLCSRYGRITEDVDWEEYECNYTEGELTEIKMSLVQKSNLSSRIRMLDLQDYLIMGQSDLKNDVQNIDSVQEDLFEAILGAIAIDSDWDMDKMQESVEIMLNPDRDLDEEANYVELIQEWTLRDRGALPQFRYEEGSYSSSWHLPFNGISQKCNTLGGKEFNELMESKQRCILYLRGDGTIPAFRGFGNSKNAARKAVCKLAYEYLEDHELLFSIRDEIEKPSKDMAINQLEILARRGYFSVPTYDYSEKKDDSGNPVWTAKCRIERERKTYKATSSSKKEAKKLAAYNMLKFVLKNY